MKTNILFGSLAVFVLLIITGFVVQKEAALARSEEYGMIVFSGGAIERNVNGRTDFFELKSETVEGLPGKQTMSFLVKELNKMNEMGYEIVNVSASPVSGAPGREVYLFKRRIK